MKALLILSVGLILSIAGYGLGSFVQGLPKKPAQPVNVQEIEQTASDIHMMMLNQKLKINGGIQQ